MNYHPPQIIALTGAAGAGKDTVADILVTHARFTKIAFADALRLEVAAAFNLGGNASLLAARHTKELPQPELALKNCSDLDFIDMLASRDLPPAVTAEPWLSRPRSPRQILQLWGTEYRRAQNPDYWTQRLSARVQQLQAAGEIRIVVTDLRFANEAAEIVHLGGTIWRVDRQLERDLEGQHASALQWRDLPYQARIDNQRDIPTLRSNVLWQWLALDMGMQPQELALALMGASDLIPTEVAA